MNTKPEIHYSLGEFTRDDRAITDAEAIAIWDSATGNWSMRAFNQMRKLQTPNLHETALERAAERAVGA